MICSMVFTDCEHVVTWFTIVSHFLSLEPAVWVTMPPSMSLVQIWCCNISLSPSLVFAFIVQQLRFLVPAFLCQRGFPDCRSFFPDFPWKYGTNVKLSKRPQPYPLTPNNSTNLEILQLWPVNYAFRGRQMRSFPFKIFTALRGTLPNVPLLCYLWWCSESLVIATRE